jgi:hypothetical protein
MIIPPDILLDFQVSAPGRLTSANIGDYRREQSALSLSTSLFSFQTLYAPPEVPVSPHKHELKKTLPFTSNKLDYP